MPIIRDGEGPRRFKPPINQDLAATPHARWLEENDKSNDSSIESILSRLTQLEKSNNESGRQVAIVNNIARRTRNTVSGIRTLPEGGSAQDGLYIDPSGALSWRPNITALVPVYDISLEGGAEGFYWIRNTNASDPYDFLPPVEFYDDGKAFYPPVMARQDGAGFGDGDTVPASYNVSVLPASNGEAFTLGIRSSAVGYGVEPGPTVVTVRNDSDTYTATVKFDGSDTFSYYDHFAYPDASATPLVAGSEAGMMLGPYEEASWVSVFDPWGFSRILTPVVRFVTDDNDAVVRQPMDSVYWANHAALRQQASFQASGTVAVGYVGGATNDNPDSFRIGKIRATVGTAPTGSALRVDVKLGGVSILSAPLEVAASATTGAVVPDAYTHGPTGTTGFPIGTHVPDSVIWLPGDALTVEVTQVGSTTPGSDLTVQVWFG